MHKIELTVDEIEYAILEHNGSLSIFRYNKFKTKSNYPMPLIIDGKIQYNTLKDINKTSYWLIKEISKKNLKLKNIFYAFYKNKSIYIIKNNIEYHIWYKLFDIIVHLWYNWYTA